jgi:hypothetical protein
VLEEKEAGLALARSRRELRQALSMPDLGTREKAFLDDLIYEGKELTVSNLMNVVLAYVSLTVGVGHHLDDKLTILLA